MKKSILVILICLVSYSFASSQVVSSGKATIRINNRAKIGVRPDGQAVAGQPGDATEAPVILGKYYALVIGIDKYEDPKIPSLDKPVRDAERFYNVITTRYLFNTENVKILRNAKMADIVNALDEFAKKVRPEDNFLIFYAGHGIYDANADIGFWLPSDARRDSKLAWFRNSTLRDYLKEIKSKHTLLVSDACFGGSIFKTRAGVADAVAINKLYNLPSRKAMTSGTYQEEVPDESAFIRYMLDRLLNNTDKFLSSEQLFSNFKMAVINNSNIVPQFGVIQDTGDEGGDFIFILRE
jgi:hypothetical protein